MIRAYRLYSGPDGNSHVERGSITDGAVIDAESIQFKETPAHSAYDWHPDPEPRYVITLSGTLEFETRGGERFTLTPGEVLVATDDTGTGHRWRLVDDQPWRRAYVVFPKGADTRFVPDQVEEVAS